MNELINYNVVEKYVLRDNKKGIPEYYPKMLQNTPDDEIKRLNEVFKEVKL